MEKLKFSARANLRIRILIQLKNFNFNDCTDVDCKWTVNNFHSTCQIHSFCAFNVKCSHSQFFSFNCKRVECCISIKKNCEVMKNDDEKLPRPILSNEQEDYISTVDSGIKFLRACFVIRNAMPPRSSRGRKDETRIHGIRGERLRIRQRTVFSLSLKNQSQSKSLAARLRLLYDWPTGVVYTRWWIKYF